ncbi:MAG: hypothetical protein SFW36_14240, partial [Leptolyngbyaceae cyanobacterium bins.59]|nr:hypothetical protein [Leptolyngbyaceae cyanobacterium bins.59]
MKERSWLIYALGGGWGHVNRSIALARTVAQHFPVTILSNTPYLKFFQDSIAEGGLQIEIDAIPASAGVETVQMEVERAFSERTFTCLIVDTFPRGLAGELVPFLEKQRKTPRILVHRDLNPNYVRSKRLQSFVMEHFDRLLIPGEGDHGSDERSWETRLPLSDLPQAYHTAPWLLRNFEELPDRAAARSLLGLDNHCPQKVVL